LRQYVTAVVQDAADHQLCLHWKAGDSGLCAFRLTIGHKWTGLAGRIKVTSACATHCQ
jgi:hypothetical protein